MQHLLQRPLRRRHFPNAIRQTRDLRPPRIDQEPPGGVGRADGVDDAEGDASFVLPFRGGDVAASTVVGDAAEAEVAGVVVDEVAAAEEDVLWKGIVRIVIIIVVSVPKGNDGRMMDWGGGMELTFSLGVTLMLVRKDYCLCCSWQGFLCCVVLYCIVL